MGQKKPTEREKFAKTQARAAGTRVGRKSPAMVGDDRITPVSLAPGRVSGMVGGFAADPNPRSVMTRIRNLYEATPDEIRDAGAGWYPNVHEAAAKGALQATRSGMPRTVHQASGVIASVSPNMDWERNNVNSFDELNSLTSSDWRVLEDSMARSNEIKARNRELKAQGVPEEELEKGGRSPEAKELLSGMGLATAPDPNIMKAKRIWVDNEDPESVLVRKNAPKTNSFMHNIADPNTAGYTTVDGRMGDMITDTMRPWEMNRGISSVNLPGRAPSRYDQYSSMIANLAANTQHPFLDRPLHPHELQGILWEQGKQIERGWDPSRSLGSQRLGQSYEQRQNAYASLGRNANFLMGTGAGELEY